MKHSIGHMILNETAAGREKYATCSCGLLDRISIVRKHITNEKKKVNKTKKRK